MSFQPNVVFALVVLAAFCVSYSVVVAKPNANSVQDLEMFEAGLNRTKRQLGDAGIGVGVDWVTKSITNAFECSEKAGCQKGHCWAWCGVSLTGGEWCYTTRSYSQSFQYVTCNQDSDCDKCWKCAGSCTL
ncbi:allergen Tha p 2-like [Sitodiplosis mosellana]|uniref:allergen Tha p 2-like n=1 Tax=Sitodiplosis mosellana TaxID=263140 RepID=UPI002443D8F8|nr:allergen Tha p 2-like [Sitodiplosis mosellana]